ncbi:MAG: DUF2130 domain-containing protein [Chitinophagaceae bacterium]
MPENIKCPSCGHEFEPTDLIRDEIEKELRTKVEDWRKKKEKEFAEEKIKLQQQIEESLRKNITNDFENKLRLLEQSNKDNQEKLKEARHKEADFLRKEMALKNKEEEIEITVQKQLQQAREKLSEDIRKIEEQRVAAKETEYQLRQKELEKQLDDQKKLVEEMRRKSEQGSSQLQGEVQELALEEMLKNAFPFDIISEVGKGKRGADCIQTVRNNYGQECGKIIYESKRGSTFNSDWTEKLKTDMRGLSADIAVIVTRTMPKDMDCFGLKDGVWVCSFSEVKAVAALLRDGVMRVYNAAKNNDNKGDKMQLLYDYLLSNEFSEQWKAIREGFSSMKLSIQREREAMERLWKAREKQLEKVLLSAAHIRGSIEGIAGQNTIDLELTGEDTNLLEE